MKINKLFLFANIDEVKELFSDHNLNLKLINPKFKLYKASLNKKTFNLLLTGIGLYNAIYSLSFIASKNKINHVINIGFAGSSFGNLLDIIEIDKTFFYDFNLTKFNYQKYQLPNLKNNYNKTNLITNYQKANLFSGSIFLDKKIEHEDKYLFDMEAAGINYVCNLNNIKISIIKVISDIIGNKQQQSDYNNIEKNGSNIIYNIVKELIK